MIINPITNQCRITAAELAAELARSEIALAKAIKQNNEITQLLQRGNRLLPKQDERRRVIKIDFNKGTHPAK
jgi:hypothetical protein